MVWDFEAGKQLCTLIGHRDGVASVAVSPDGRRAVSGSDDRTLKVWDLGAGVVLATFSGDSGVSCCAIAPDGRTIVTGEQSGRVHFLQLEECPHEWQCSLRDQACLGRRPRHPPRTRARGQPAAPVSWLKSPPTAGN
jgi:WD40 repeat protein